MIIIEEGANTTLSLQLRNPEDELAKYDAAVSSVQLTARWRTTRANMLAHAIVSKARKPKFELNLRIIDLNNVPFKSGTCHVKWYLTTSISAEHRGITEKSPIREHKVQWEYNRTFHLRLVIDKNNKLQENLVRFEIVQDYSAGGRGEKIVLGFVELNLAEYVEESEIGPDGEEGVVRRYLMQESKINSTLKIGICMKQVDGDRNYTAPPLKTAAVFGGIAGIMAGEQVEQDDPGHMPVISKSRDHGELQDMYRRALAASWQSTGAELPADQCIEDIFNGGDGWKDKRAPRHQPQYNGDDSFSDEPQRLQHHHHHHHHHHTQHHRSSSGSSLKSQSTITEKRAVKTMHRPTNSRDAASRSKGEAANDTSSENSSGTGRTRHKQDHEFDEFDIREDLAAWRLPSTDDERNESVYAYHYGAYMS